MPTSESSINSELVQLRAEVQALKARLTALEAAHTALGTAAPSRPARHRRLAISTGSVITIVLMVCLFGRQATVHRPAKASASDQCEPTGQTLQQYMDYSSPQCVTPPPLDTMTRWMRRDPEGVPAYYTNEVVSLISDNMQTNSFAWPLYIELRGTNSALATQDTSQSAGATVRAFNRSTGSPWLVGYHSEVFHGRDGVDGPIVNSNGTSILYNGELNAFSGTGTAIGLNLQNTKSSTALGTHAINIQSAPRDDGTLAGWFNGIHFDGTAGGVAGNIGINFDRAHYNMGIDLSDNSLRLNAGQKVILERFGTIYLWYNPTADRVELVKGGTVVAFW